MWACRCPFVYAAVCYIVKWFVVEISYRYGFHQKFTGINYIFLFICSWGFRCHHNSNWTEWKKQKILWDIFFRRRHFARWYTLVIIAVTTSAVFRWCVIWLSLRLECSRGEVKRSNENEWQNVWPFVPLCAVRIRPTHSPQKHSIKRKVYSRAYSLALWTHTIE